MRHLLTVADLTTTEIERIFAITEDLKTKYTRGLREALLPGRVMALLFEKPSLRTRVSFEAGMINLGGHGLFLGDDVGFGARESLADFGRVLSQYADVVVIRAFKHQTAVDLARYSTCSVINGLTDHAHPCQALADLYTLNELAGRLSGLTLAYVGDGNNVARSLAEGCGRVGMRFVMATPPGYEFDDEFLARLNREVPDLDLHVTANAVEAVRDAAAVYTDVWTSMGQEAETAKRRKDFAAYQVNAKLMSKAPKGAYFMHCLPAHRGEEVTDEVIDGPNSIVVQQASNRLHVQKGILAWILGAQSLETMNNYAGYIDEHRDRFEQDLFELLRIPSVSADSRHRGDVGRAAAWVADQFRRLKLKVELVETAGNPIVYAESPAVPGAPTVLVYGHYDVQPPDPLDQWISPPFEPTVRNGNVYARGATDDKGQMLTHVKSAEAWLAATGRLPVQLKFIIEGEEEVGSDSLHPFIMDNRDRLACDCVVISDTSQFGPGQPAITYGLRGIAYFELRLTGPKQDLHSGTFGGAVVNPANVLCELLASLANDRRQVQVPGFYDDVIPIGPEERKHLAELPFDEQEFQRQIGVDGLRGEAGYSTLERRSARPTYDINGLWSGYQGEGAKTILPGRAGAKFSFRLVPNQDPKKIATQLEAFLRARCPAGIQMELVTYSSATGVVVPLDSPYIAAAQAAIEHAFGRPPLNIREGGSIPVVATFHDLLGVDTLLLGWGLDDDNTHSPNEKFCLADFHRGIQASARLWEELGRLKPLKN